MSAKSTEFWGAVKYMPENILKERLAKAQSDIAELTQEQERRATFTPEMKLADRLHHLMHYAIDCDYHYSDWPEPKGCRHEHLQLVYQMIHTLSLSGSQLDARQQLDALLALMERQRFGAQ